MPNLVKCPKCNGAVLVGSVDDPALSVNCPLCAGSFTVGELTDLGIPLAVAAAAPAPSPPSETFGGEVIGGTLLTADEGSWSYPGCESWGAIELTEIKSAVAEWPYSSEPALEGGVALAAMVSWRYPGIDHWHGVVVESTPLESADAEATPAEVMAGFEGPSFAGIGEGAPRARAGAPTLRTGKRKKSKEVNPIFLGIGIVGGGIIGLAIGYLILVMIKGREIDFLGLFY